MLKKAFVILLFSSLFFSACSKTKEMHFTGKSKNWYVNFEAKVTSTNSETTYFTIKYRGKNSTPKKIKYYFEYPSGKVNGTSDLNNTGVLKLGGHSCSGCAVFHEDDVIKVTIIWNGESEIFELKK
ncbi:hypothetical protein [Heyndrickxia oleronia]|uniref:hypothetical protein n=1 Tax=Heyndrickxia oleronia TaxID=38875 RepID=UPI001C0EE0C3|nr:hypothetical protein [Heyndrickxia oleronia]MBU5210215.1 hypothetical protein [Heyndrickxia oleronia]